MQQELALETELGEDAPLDLELADLSEGTLEEPSESLSSEPEDESSESSSELDSRRWDA